MSHRLEIVSKFWADGYTCECSCGWSSEEMATQDAALAEGRSHVAGIAATAESDPGDEQPDEDTA